MSRLKHNTHAARFWQLLSLWVWKLSDVRQYSFFLLWVNIVFQHIRVNNVNTDEMFKFKTKNNSFPSIYVILLVYSSLVLSSALHLVTENILQTKFLEFYIDILLS